MMLYSIIDVTEQSLKDALAESCDNQPFIARAPLVWLFLADYQRWADYFDVSDVDKVCRQRSVPRRRSEEGNDLSAGALHESNAWSLPRTRSVERWHPHVVAPPEPK